MVGIQWYPEFDEISLDIEIYEKGQIVHNKTQSEVITKLVAQIKRGDKDSLSYRLKRSLNYNNYYPQQVTFNSASSSGKLDLIDDYDLRKKISLYYKVWGLEAQFKGENQIEFHKMNLTPWVLKNTDLTKSEITLETANDLELLNMLVMYQNLIDQKVSHYEKVLKEAKALRENLQELL